ncbi:hypothetical protein SCHPADRAFT_822182 [Schizopora paradoxa]|uniref:PINIT domain-containing protein n=1 Tax=Schizopora paradoxa TaxID=27342 RepID=A0A0H2RYA8_9AGAM|nr:hypothetical protein SCHPADRAFT_822182 [Schizopora paradoxa]
MASSTQQEPWTDFDALRHGVKSHTVDRLKQIIQGISEENNVSLSKSGKKQDLIDRIVAELDKYHIRRLTEEWSRARAVLYQVKSTGSYTGSGTSLGASYTHSSAHGTMYTTPKTMANGTSLSGSSTSTSSIGRFDPYAPPRRAVPGPSTPAPPRTSNSIRFKPSPFLRIDQMVSIVQECPESTGNADRKTAFLQFTLNQDQIAKLQTPNTKYQLRLFCTTSTFYTPPSPNSFRTVNQPCPIEFPATCEVRINNVALTANLKGIKKKPGTAPPANITSDTRKIAGSPNRIDIVYVNSSQGPQPPPPKKYYLVVMLVEITTVDELVERLKKGKFRSYDDTKTKMAKASSDDDDIVMGKQKMTLKCPLSYTRIKLPCRSDKCVHPQCFEAFSWYSVMEQTTTWLCPVCEHVLNPEELIVDGYFAEILKKTPDSVEEVEVEPDGEWHTEDNKYGSPEWLVKHPPKGNVQKAPLPGSSRNYTPAVARNETTTSPARGAVQRKDDVVILDDSDDDEGLVKKELSPTDYPVSRDTSTSHIPRPAAAPAPTSAATVIDLTLDSDDEDPPPPPVTLAVKRAEKRKADESTNGRTDDPKRQRPADLPNRPARQETNGHLNGGGANVSLANPPSTSWNASSRSPNLPSSSHLPGQRPPPPNRPPSYERPPGLPVHDSYSRPRPVTDNYSYNGNPPYRASNGLPYNNMPPPPANDRRLPPLPAYNTNPYLPRGSGEQGARWP